ncbi:flagellar hook-basal body protein [Paenibacillus agilis]|uniref:Flagellar hook-basal body protein n=1 Tax=Paenibacillus agilis TaxID=3020863 RepID=A0A559IPC1_9BACL|nr:flagellar hook-basal body protein [Paenibacillus agilis]TVX89475.1 flagellar hook-basal body protein [Paenibacillus agilis]
MNISMITASTAMNGLQNKLDVIADNVANVDTNGYKRKTATFADVMTNVLQQGDDFERPGRATPSGYTTGYGSRLNSIQRDFSLGELVSTGVDTDIALQGNGLFEVQTAEGNAFVREGQFQLMPDERAGVAPGGILTTKQGHVVMGANDQPIRIRNGFELRIDSLGRVFEYNSAVGDPIQVGVLKIVEPTKPELLMQADDNLYVIPAGTPRETVVTTLNLTNIPPDGMLPLTVRQGMLEKSNVSLTDEMADLIQAQRAYQMAARALSSGDSMWGLANSLRG